LATAIYLEAEKLLNEYKLSESEILFCKALKSFLAVMKFKEAGDCYSNLGIICEMNSKNPEAIENYFLAIESYEKADFKPGLADSYNNLGIVYCINQQYEEGLKYYLKSLKIEEELGNEEGISYSYGNIGLVYRKMGNIPKAIEYYNKSLSIKTRLNDKKGMAITYSNLGSIYVKLDSLSKAMILFENALNLHEQIGNKEGQGYALHNMGDALIIKEDYTKAIDYLNKSLNIRTEIGDEKGQTSSLYSLSEAYFKLNDSHKFLEYASKCQTHAQQTSQQDILLKLLYLYYLFYQSEQNIEKALESLEQYIELKSKIDEQIRTEQILEMQARFDTEKKELEIAKKDSKILNLEQEKQIQSLKIRNDRLFKIFLIVIIVFIFAITYILFKRNRFKSKMNKILTSKNRELEETNATKNKFFSIISHDLSNYAAVMESVSGMLKRKHKMMNPDTLEQNMEALNNSAVLNKKVIHNLLEWAMAQNRRISLNPDYHNLFDLCSELIESLQSIAASKSIKIIPSVESNITVFADINTIKTVLRNLVSNAIKFSSENSEIHILGRVVNDKVEIIVRDFGQGIKSDEIGLLFKPDVNTKRIGTPENKGTGFGLILCKEFVEMNNGEIYVQSEFGKGTDFIFTLPIKYE
jgi:signal transduction histidine kinase/Tfp pilus assembly protein PilF